ncbi:hypothetical protein AAVH_23898 [Aphelenchoides avenae]|nr:hypothetical protein AAVH_23898 [Aphelenchus avenae]
MGVVSVVANVVVLYLIKYHSKFASPAYQMMLTIDASLDFVLCVFALIGQPMGLVVDGYTLYFSDGFFAGQWPTLDSILLAGWFLCELYNIMWIAIQFIYRYSIVCLEQA